MHKRWLLTLLFFSFLILGCQGSISESSVSLIASENLLSFELDDSTSNISAFLGLYYEENSDRELLFSLNQINNEIQVYNIEDQRLVNKLLFDIEGERGVGSITGFHIQNLDSLFLFPNNGNRFFLTNDNANEIRRFDYKVPEGYGNAQVASSYFSANAFLQSGQLMVKTLYQGNYSNINNEELGEKYLSSAINLSSGLAEHIPITYPEDYMEDVKKHFQFSLSTSDNGTVYSFWADHNLYLMKTSTSEKSKVEAPSQYLGGEWEPLPLGGDRVDRARYFATSAHYGNIIYDPFRSVYYRFCYPKVDVSNDEDLRMQALYPSTFSVMILDEELNVLGEEFFGEDVKLLTSNVFVGRKGLYISVSHPDNDLNEEDYMRFRLYELKR